MLIESWMIHSATLALFHTICLDVAVVVWVTCEILFIIPIVRKGFERDLFGATDQNMNKVHRGRTKSFT